jgi:pimeloyl-ACP methyl ester carboxylesterase
MLRRASGPAVAAAQRAMAGRQDFSGWLAHIAVPTLVMVGAEDPIATPEEAAVWCRCIPQTRLVRLEQAGHLPPLETPERFEAALLEFLRAAEQPTTAGGAIEGRPAL